jgi:hypothetical protein
VRAQIPGQDHQPHVTALAGILGETSRAMVTLQQATEVRGVRAVRPKRMIAVLHTT